MRPLALEEICSDCDVVSHAEGPLMSAWDGLLAAPPPEAGAALVDLLGLPPTGEVTAAIREVRRVALLVPRAPDLQSVLRRRTLVVELAAGGGLFFRGHEQWLPFDWPPDYRAPLARLGLLCLTGQDETFVDGGSESRAIARKLEAAGKTDPGGLRPFYTDGQDRYSCWAGGDFSRTWCYDRRTNELQEESTGGFPGWLAARLAALREP